MILVASPHWRVQVRVVASYPAARISAEQAAGLGVVNKKDPQGPREGQRGLRGHLLSAFYKTNQRGMTCVKTQIEHVCRCLTGSMQLGAENSLGGDSDLFIEAWHDRDAQQPIVGLHGCIIPFRAYQIRAFDE